MGTKAIRLSDGTDTLLPESAVFGSDANGSYTKFADGTLIQWGYTAGAYSVGDRTDVQVTMPVAFVDFMYTVTANGLAASDKNNYETVIIITRDTVQKFTAHLRNNSSNYIRQFNWIAIGRWK